ncbi:MAG: hypothetical protein KatS3mg002_1098 [Candidatus Woesearchaeota archaeon]|nr:MAG: hypothetical protein KatS3mg002_1098 [Candidatus Woesearchaeota archaeon]
MSFEEYFDSNLEKNLNKLNKLADMSLSSIVKSTLKGVSTVKDTFNAGKIIDYYQMAVRAKALYNDQKLFDYLKTESQYSYNSIGDQKIKNFVKQQVDDFVK